MKLLPVVPARRVTIIPARSLMKWLVSEIRCFVGGHYELMTARALWPSPDWQLCCMKCGRRRN